MTLDEVILVDTNDCQTGTMEKMEAHEKGLLHRAFSVFILNNSGRILLQRRASGKYHSPGLWTNTCCSHPRPGEPVEIAAVRRLQEEMGIKCSLKKLFTFIYRAEFDNGLTEHELDHVFAGISDSIPVLNTEEADDYEYVDPDYLSKDIEKFPGKYTIWFRIAYPGVKQILREYSDKSQGAPN